MTDALEESYFGWDAERFPARGEHNAARAEGQWQLYEAIRATRARRRELLRRSPRRAPGPAAGRDEATRAPAFPRSDSET